MNSNRYNSSGQKGSLNELPRKGVLTQMPVEQTNSSNLSMLAIYALIKCPEDFNQLTIIIEGGKEKFDRFKVLNSYGKYRLFAYEISLDGMTKSFDYRLQIVNSKRQEVSEVSTRSLEFTPGAARQEQFICNFAFPKQIKNLPIQGVNNILEVAFVFTYMLSAAGRDRETLYNFLNQVQSLKSQEIDDDLEMLLSLLPTGDLLKNFQEIWFALHGKLFAWSELMKIKDKDFAVYAKSIPRFEKKTDEIAKILNNEKDQKKAVLIMSGIQDTIIIDLVHLKKSIYYEAFLDKSYLLVEFFIETFQFLPNTPKKAEIQNKIVGIIDKAEISPEEKLNLLLRLMIWDFENLTMNMIIKAYNNLKTNDFDKELAAVMTPTQLESKCCVKFKEALISYAKHNELIYLSHALMDFHKILKLDDKIFSHAVSFAKTSQSLQTEESAEKFSAQTYIQIASEFIEEANKNGVANTSKEEPINRIISELGMAQELCEFLKTMKEDDFDELKDFVNDQDESYVNVKTIKMFEYIWNFAKNVIDQSHSLSEFITKCKEVLDSEDYIKENRDISVYVKECIEIKTSLERTLVDMKNKDDFFKIRIKEILTLSTIKIIDTARSKKITVTVYTPDLAKEKEVYSLGYLKEFREKAILMMNSTEEGDQAKSTNNLSMLRQFVDIVDAAEIILNCYGELEYRGHIQNFIDNNNSEIKFEMPKDQENMLEYEKRVKKYTEEWKEHLDSLYATSYLFSHFYGNQLRDLYHEIIDAKGQSSYIKNLLLFTNIDSQNFSRIITEKRKKGEIEEITKADLFKQVSFIRNLLEEASPEVWKYKDNQYENVPPKLKLVNVSKENTFLGLAQSVTETELQEAKQNQFLFCRPKTNLLDITCFLHRAFLNNQSLPFFLVGFECLSGESQNHFCETLEHLLKTLRSYKKNVNLVVIGSKTTEKIYSHLYYHKEFSKKSINHIENEKSCVKILLELAQDCQIAISDAPGLGKTEYILRQCKAQNLKPCFFPIAGDITDENMAKRFSTVKIGKDTALIVQLHNVVNSKLLDEILFQLVFFRSLKTNSFLFFPEHRFPLFIEVQNLLDEQYLDSLRTLAIFRNSEALKSIQEANVQDLYVDNDDLKFHFVLKYMKALHEGKLAETDIPYTEFKKSFDDNDRDSRTDETLCQSLLTKYFFGPLSNNRPSFRQLRYFIEISFSALKTFADSPYLSQASIYMTFDTMSKRTKELLAQILRSDFVRIILENSREFLMRTVLPDSFSDQKQITPTKNSKSFGDKLRNFSLLIMKQGDSEDDYSYSLIYDDVDKVPRQLKMYFVVQTRPGTGEGHIQTWMTNETKLNREFEKDDLTTKTSDQLLETLKTIAGVATVKPDPDYAITLDNFYKMCLIIQRMRSRIPIVIMGETGVGKTALIRFIVENVYGDELEVFNVHAGVNFQVMVDKMKNIRERAAGLSYQKKLWVFFDEFNTSEEVGYISEIILNNRFLGEPIEGNIVFVGACNPFRKRGEAKGSSSVGITKVHREQDHSLLYRVLPSPESLLDVMWDFQDLKEAETLKYLETILKVDYRPDKVVKVVDVTHKFFREKVEKSAVSLRDVSRFKILFNWFMKFMPSKPANKQLQANPKPDDVDNYQISRRERAFILTLCFCYYLKLSTMPLRKEYIGIIEGIMGFKQGYILKVLENEQMDYIRRMELPSGIALNLALRENVFAALVCFMNKIPIIIVGMPGCSKSLAMRLLCANLRGRKSQDEFFRDLMELSVVQFQGSEACTSEDVEKLFERAKRNLNLKDVMSTVLFDEIGLAEVSPHNPLKVLHSHLEVGKSEVSFIGISNWQLDAAKMGRFLVLARPVPDENELKTTATEISQSILESPAEEFNKLILALSSSYWHFITKWKASSTMYPEFFGLRDFYSLIKFVTNQLKSYQVTPKDREAISRILRRGVERNFDGQENSVNMFLQEISKQYSGLKLFKDEELDVMGLIQESLQDPDSRCLLMIIRGEALIHMASRNIKIGDSQIIMICGSTFPQDNVDNEEYNIRVMSDFVNHVEKGNVIACKDLNSSIQTSLYDLYNKSYHKIGGNDYCRISMGVHSSYRCIVHPNFDCIVYINEDKLEEVDPPFLNRFEKHYLTLDRFLSQDESSTLEAVQEWINKVTSRYFLNDPPLTRENFFVNSSDEALASLCIKTFYDLKSSQESYEDLVKESVEQCKKELMQNSTSDLILWANSSNLKNQEREDYNFIIEQYKAKYQILSQDYSTVHDLKLVIFTYEQNMGVNPWESDKTKVLKMVEMKCEKDLKFEIASYFEGHHDLCVIKMDFETEIKHLSLLLSLIDTIQKVSNKHSKNFILILYHSRAAIARSGETPLRAISYLNGWKQVFLETLSEQKSKVEELPLKLCDLVEKENMNIKEIINKSFQNSLQRFNFKFKTDFEDVKYLSAFVKFVLDVVDDKFFLHLAERYIDKLLKKNQFKDWRKEVLNHTEIANLAQSVHEAISFYVTERIEDLLTITLKRLFEEETFASIFPDPAIALLENSLVKVRDHLKSKLSKLEYSFDFHEDLFDNCLPASLEQLPRAVNSIDIVLNHPKLFPFSKKDEDCIFVQEAGGSSMSLYAIALQLKEVEQAAAQKTIRSQEGQEGQEAEEVKKEKENSNGLENPDESEAQYESLVKMFNQTYSEKTRLTRYDLEGNCVMNILEKLNSEQYVVEKELYLLDIRNIFLEKVIKTEIKNSNFLDKLVMLFLDTNYLIEDYLMVLLRGEPLWKNLMKIYQIIEPVIADKSIVEQLFFPKLDLTVKAKLGIMINAQVTYVKFFLESCEKLLSPTNENIKTFKGSKSYSTVVINAYFGFLNLQTEFEKFDVHVPIMLTIWRNFIELIESLIPGPTDAIFKELTNRLENHHNGSVLPCIDDFLEDFKKNKPRSHKIRITNFQAAVLYRYWIVTHSENFAQRLLQRINHTEDFPNFCSSVLSSIFPIEPNSNMKKVYQQLEQLDDVTMMFNKSIPASEHSNILSIILTDYFEKVLAIPEVGPLDPEESKASKHITTAFPSFQNCFDKIDNTKFGNHIQVLAMMAFFKQYLRSYAECLLEKKAYPILKNIDQILSKESPLADSLCVYVLKVLRTKQASFNRLKKCLAEAEKMKWIYKFRSDFETVSGKTFFIPGTLQFTPEQQIVQEKWIEFREKDFNDEKLFEEILNYACMTPYAQYQLMNIFLTDIYAGLITGKRVDNLKEVVNDKRNVIRNRLSEYHQKLILCYVERRVDNYLCITEDTTTEMLNTHILVLNVVNWLICLKNVKSAWTNLFFKEGAVPQQYDDHFSRQFMLTGMENPYVQNALRVAENYRYFGVYVCSSKCDYIYTIADCGWPSYTMTCPFCKEDIGNARGQPSHTLARTQHGARRLGRHFEKKWDYLTYVCMPSLQADEDYWKGVENDIYKEADRMRDKNTIKIWEGTTPGKLTTTEVPMTGYNRHSYTKNDKFQIFAVERLRKMADSFLRFVLHSSLYILSTFKWTSAQEMMGVTKMESYDAVMTYLKDNIEGYATEMQKDLDCNDSIIWILALQQMLPSIVQDLVTDETEVWGVDRDAFEQKVEEAIYNNLGDQQKILIKKYKEVSQMSLQKLDSVICEENEPAEYKYLHILRLSKMPSLEDMMTVHDRLIKNKYPLLDECLKNLSEIKAVSNLAHIVQFSNEVMRLTDYQITRDDAKTLKISEFIEKLPENRQKNMNKLLNNFLKSWNNLDLGPIQYQCKILGTMTKYSRDSPVIAFLIDSMDVNNVYGKILSGVIYTLSDKQNNILNQIAQRAAKLNHLKNIQFFDSNIYLPQSATSEDILSITEKAVEDIIAATSSSNFVYGNGVPIYDFERVQVNLIPKIVGKKMFVTDLNLYQNVRFISETFSKKGKFSDYISQIRKLGLTASIPNIAQLEAKFKTLQEKSSNQFYSTLKVLLGSLEKLMTFYKNLAETNIKLSDYVRKYKFTAISPLITEEAPIKDYDISCIVALYEWAEKMTLPNVWTLLPGLYKSKKLEEDEKEIITTCFLKMKDQNANKEAQALPDLTEFATALARFASRCLMLGDFEGDNYLTDWLYVREDFWEYPYKESEVELLAMEFPPVTFDKIYDLYQTAEAIINPQREAPKSDIKEIIPNRY